MESMHSVLPVNQAEAARDAARRQAIFSGGHKFIWLTLLNTRFRTISGIDVIHATPYIDEMAGGITRFNLSSQGGYTDFQFDTSRGVFRYAMLDCEHNRRFLASHYHLNFWQIEDEGVSKTIEGMSKDIEKQVKQVKGSPEKTPAVESPSVSKQIGRSRKSKTQEKPAQVTMEKAAEIDPAFAGIQSDMVSPRSTRVVTP